MDVSLVFQHVENTRETFSANITYSPEKVDMHKLERYRGIHVLCTLIFSRDTSLFLGTKRPPKTRIS